MDGLPLLRWSFCLPLLLRNFSTLPTNVVWVRMVQNNSIWVCRLPNSVVLVYSLPYILRCPFVDDASPKSTPLQKSPPLIVWLGNKNFRTSNSWKFYLPSPSLLSWKHSSPISKGIKFLKIPPSYQLLLRPYLCNKFSPPAVVTLKKCSPDSFNFWESNSWKIPCLAKISPLITNVGNESFLEIKFLKNYICPHTAGAEICPFDY